MQQVLPIRAGLGRLRSRSSHAVAQVVLYMCPQTSSGWPALSLLLTQAVLQYPDTLQPDTALLCCAAAHRTSVESRIEMSPTHLRHPRLSIAARSQRGRERHRTVCRWSRRG